MDRNGGERRSLVVTGHGLILTGRVRSVAEQRVARVRSVQPARPVDRGTGASSQAPRGTADRKVDRTRCASSHDRSDTSGHEWMLTGNDRMLTLWRPVCQAYASSRGFTRAGDVQTARPICVTDVSGCV
jgi:hypothetical protein